MDQRAPRTAAFASTVATMSLIALIGNAFLGKYLSNFFCWNNTLQQLFYILNISSQMLNFRLLTVGHSFVLFTFKTIYEV